MKFLDMKLQSNDLLKSALVLLASSMALLPVAAAAEQDYEYTKHSYRSGQHTEVAYEGWRTNDDGTLRMTFGYFNHNWEEELDIPVGENNRFTTGDADRGQPTHFLPRRNRFTFDVDLPAGFGGDDELVWEVTSPNGVTRAAYGTLREDYKIENITIMSETGALGAGSSDPETRANIPPVSELIGDEIRTVNVGQSLTFSTRVSDDGVPQPFDPMRRVRLLGGAAAAFASEEMIRDRMMMMPPPKPTVAKNNGLYLSWNVYRAPEGIADAQTVVHFDPPQIKPWEDTRPTANSPWSWLWVPPEMPEDGVVEVSVSFDEPGTYLLWGRADDGGLYTDQYLTVNVTP
ncbi:MAG: hypothetical protein HOF74_00275 [Gammaproteobacteria bacterium]|jgi:hypothetical protein|nr:hypothetical protein [Gammaproteobacteria bacterium]MBT3858242.1 hypothetical protein [Gammaproteobacteria bacterium]MBT3988682.1 hypothetical protein [Gammaproteobacteria bacterium]MBT4580638.1 hypothetical protein [Gammaproteobacteria bacterium]MBT4657839.1 hypothetical protein [Gammaproteobacteria bacterium]